MNHPGAIPLRSPGLARLTPLGFGAFKIGRNQGTKYAAPYELPDDVTVARLLHGVLDLGCRHIDTAPAYGRSEERIGQHLADRRDEFVLSTKVGETFAEGRSTFDFSRFGIEASVRRSLERLKTDHVDLLLLHSDGRDLELQDGTDAIDTLQRLREQGLTRAIGISSKQVAGATRALDWADAIMVEYHIKDRSHADVIAAAQRSGVAVLVKKGLASGRLSPEVAIPAVLEQPGVTTLVVGGLSLAHFGANWRTALQAAG